MMVQFSILPVSDSSHISEPISKALKIVHESGVEYRLTPMGTLLKGDWKEVMHVIKKCHYALREDFDRIVTSIKIDDVKSSDPDFDHKIEAVEQKAETEFRK